MTQSTEQMHQLLELVLTELDRKAIPIAYMQDIDRKGKAFIEQAARRAPVVPETIEQRAQKLKGLQVLIGATAGVSEAIELARSRFVEAYGRSPLHDDLAYACLLIEAFGAPVVPHGWKLVPKEATPEMLEQVWYLGYDEMRDAYCVLVAAAPHPPEAAQLDDTNVADMAQAVDSKEAAHVQLPEPEANVHAKLGNTCMFPSTNMRKGDKIYTEQQVRQLLAAHGIKEQST